MKVFIDEHRDAYGVEPICKGCRSPHRPTTRMPRGAPIPASYWHGPGATPC